MTRRVQAELLDTLPPEDPRAIRSRLDLCRVNWWMGNHATMARALQENFREQLPGRILEIGAGDGNFLLRVAQKLSPAWSGTKATLLDRQFNIPSPTTAAFQNLRWELSTLTTDVFDWSPEGLAEPVVLANLFLHHFEESRLAELLEKVSRCTSFFIAIEPRRLAWPAVGGFLLKFIGCNDVTRHDGTVSIRAGFDGCELSSLWPDRKNWQLAEQPSGLFSHLFIARRLA